MEKDKQPTPENPMGSELSPQEVQKGQAYVSGLAQLLHSEETSPRVVQMLQAAEPLLSIPKAAEMINGMLEEQLPEKPSLDTLMAGGVFLVTDLVEIGNAAGIFEITDEEEIGTIMQVTFEKYITDGLKDGSIDPVELQQRVEPLMTDEHRQLAGEAGKQHGIPPQPDDMVAMEQYASKRERKALLKGRK